MSLQEVSNANQGSGLTLYRFEEVEYADYGKVAALSTIIMGPFITTGICSRYFSTSKTALLGCTASMGSISFSYKYRKEMEDLFAKIILRKFLGARLERSLTPGPNENYYYNHHREDVLAMLPRSSITKQYVVEGTRKLDTIWIPCEESAKAILILPGNGVTAGPMWPLGKWYYEHGYNVLMLTMCGYRGRDGVGSDGELLGISGELTLVRDASIVLSELQQMGFDKKNIGIHGYSTGGYFAAYLGYYYHVNKVVLDRAFTTFSDVASFATHEWLTPSMLDLTYCSPPENDNDHVATRLNTIEVVKASASYVNYLVLQADQDQLMPIRFGERLAEASGHDNLVIFSGTHKIQDLFFPPIPNYPEPQGLVDEEKEELKFKEGVESAMVRFWNI